MKSIYTTLFAVICVAVVCQFVRPLSASESDDRVYTIFYGTSGLPVFTAKQEFDPSVLISHIKRSVAPDSWDSKDKFAGISGSKEHLAVVVSQTSENHKQVKRLLESLRGK